nr:hypothetical protein [Wolbachia endosymbiont of Onchocerca gibsoni]
MEKLVTSFLKPRLSEWLTNTYIH